MVKLSLSSNLVFFSFADQLCQKYCSKIWKKHFLTIKSLEKHSNYQQEQKIIKSLRRYNNNQKSQENKITVDEQKFFRIKYFSTYDISWSSFAICQVYDKN